MRRFWILVSELSVRQQNERASEGGIRKASNKPDMNICPQAAKQGRARLPT